MVTTQAFPKEEELQLTLKIRTTTEEDRSYFYLPSGEINPGFLADCYDMLDMIREHIISINGKNLVEYQKILQGQVRL